jgi:hypothetical protein
LPLPGLDYAKRCFDPRALVKVRQDAVTSNGEQLLLAHIQKNPINGKILQLAPLLGVSDRWLTAGALFQTVWNVLEGRAPQAGIRDYDLFYFDEDTSYEAENEVILRASEMFGDLGVEVEVRNEARVHLTKTKRWSAQWPSLTVLPWPKDSSADQAPAPSLATGALPS